MNKEGLFKILWIFVFSVLFYPSSSLSKDIQDKALKILEGEWYLYPGELGKIDMNVRSKPITRRIWFARDFAYREKDLTRKTEIRANWTFVDSQGVRSLIIKDEKDSLLHTFQIKKLSRYEMVVKEGNQVYLYISEKNKRPYIDRFRGIFGIFVLIFLAFLLSNNKKSINWRTVGVGLGLQIIIALSVLKVGFIRTIFEGISSFFVKLLAFTREGSLFLFGDLIEKTDTFGYIFAFQVLPTVIFFSAFTSVLYYFGILQFIVKIFAWVMQKTMVLSGSESLAAAANIFIGQTEAPLVIKPYLPKMTPSEILALMTGGMATIAGGVLAAYIGFLGGPDPVQQKIFATHLLTASIMNAPAALFIAKIIFPQTGEVNKELNISKEVIGSNLLDSIAKGTIDGLRLAVNVGAMLLVFIALMALLNFIVTNWIGEPTGLNRLIVEKSGGRFEGLNMQFILGTIFSPIAWLIGIPSYDIFMVGQLLGEKTILNEFYAYVSLSNLKNSFLLTDAKSVLIATYALCGFANFSSIGIQIGGISALAPNQRVTLSQLGIKALIGGTIATLLTASIAGIIL